MILSSGGGFSASGSDFTVNIGAAAAALTWGVTANFVTAGNSLTFGSPFADRTVIWTNPVVLATSGSATRDILARRGVGTVPEGRVAAVISDAGGTGSLSMSGPGTLELAAANTYSGITTINGIGTSTYLGTPNMGALRLGQVAALPAGNLVLNGGVLETRGSFYASQTFNRAAGAGANQVTWTSGGFAAYGTGAADDLVVANALPTAAVNLAFGAPDANRTVRCTANAALVNDLNVVVHRGCGNVPEAELAGNITGAKALNVVAGSLGMLVLSGANGYTGATTVNCGWLRIGGASAIPNGNLKLGSALIRQFGVIEGSVAWSAITRALGTGNGQIVWQQGGGGFSASGADLTVNLGGAAATLTWGTTASFVPDRGVLAFGSPYADRTVCVQNPLNLGVRPMGTDSPVVASLMRELTVIRGLGTSPEVDLAGGVLGSEAQVGLLKNGDGILELSANNTYPGATLIQGGTLLVNGTLAAGGGLVTVGTGARAATLGGTGSVNRDVAVRAVATVAPGASGIGTLMIDGDIAFATNAIFAVQLNGSACDKLSVSGSVSLDGAILMLDPISLPTRERVVVVAEGGVSGEFGAVEGLPAGYFVRYDTGHVIVTRPAQGTQLLVR